MTTTAVSTIYDFTSNIRMVNPDGSQWIAGNGASPWFVAKDVAEGLEMEWKGAGTIAHIPNEWIMVLSVGTIKGNRDTHALSLEGLNFFIGRSDKPKAIPFQKWVFGTVIPSIQKTGQYQHPQAAAPAPAIEQVNHQVINLELTGAIAHFIVVGVRNNLPEDVHPSVNAMESEMKAELAQGITKLGENVRRHALILTKNRIDQMVKDLAGDVQPPQALPAPSRRRRTMPFSLPETLPNTNAQEQEFIRIFNETGNASRAYREVFSFNGTKQALVGRASRLVMRLSRQLNP